MSRSEQELAAVLVDWLKRDGWEVYQEVELAGSVLDVCAVRAGVLWAIEVKTSFGLDVLAQAHNWSGLAHKVSVAVPAPKRRERKPGKRLRNRKSHALRSFEREILRRFSIGKIVVGDHVEEKFAAESLPSIDPELRLALRPEQQTWSPAGNPGAKRYTPFTATRAALIAHVARNPGTTLRDAVKAIRHHYRNDGVARSSIAAWVRSELIKGVRIEREGRLLRIYPE